MKKLKVAIDWCPGVHSGWEVYGLNLALQWASDPQIELWHPYQQIAGIDPLRERILRNSLVNWDMDAADIYLHALGNQFLHEPKTPRDRTAGVIFFEQGLTPEAIESAKKYPLIITGSTWNQSVLRSYGLENVELVLQGVDRSLFHPAQPVELFKDKFPVFSGGKAEWRKGQDIVLREFKEFHVSHPNAVLVTAWQSIWDPRIFDRGMVFEAHRFYDEYTKLIDVKAWAEWEGINPDAVIDLGLVSNYQMPAILRECCCAVFPSRTEGGTNLVAMEALACGIPTWVSSGTGHDDLRLDACMEPSMGTFLHKVYRGYPYYTGLSGFHWSDAASKLKQLCFHLAKENA
jgi:glycosyltransferase involved in cell wall biosynthesis